MRLRVFFLVLLLAASDGAMAAAPSPALDPVVRLYRDFAWTAVIEEPRGEVFVTQPAARLLRYLTPGLAQLIRQDRACVARTREICKLDFDPIWASQDSAATQLRIVAGDAPGTIVMTYIYPGPNSQVSLRYSVVKQGEQWRIDDIHYADGNSLRKILSRPD